MEISNPDRVVFPDDGITKGDVVDYYRLVGDRILPFLSGRALTVERFPKGLSGKGFMQKNVPRHAPKDLIARHEVPKEDGVTTHPVIDSKRAIVFFANLGVITFHIPPALVADWRHPDWMIWHLDPTEGRVDMVREAARRLRDALLQWDISTVLMTSGSKGYHLRTPLKSDVEWEVAARVARGLAALVAAENEGLMTCLLYTSPSPRDS